MGSLPKALAARGHRVMVVAPRYMNYESAFDTKVRLASCLSRLSEEWRYRAGAQHQGRAYLACALEQS
eukprot:48854-Pelagomonas_calceolata.AAC.1